MILLGFPGGAGGKESACQCKRHEIDPWVGKIPWRGSQNPLQHSCLENPMDRGSLAGYIPWGLKESDTTEAT